MNGKNILLAGGFAALGLVLIALPGTSKQLQEATRPAAPAASAK